MKIIARGRVLRALLSTTLLLGLTLAPVLRTAAAELHVAVAANFSGPLQQLAPLYQRRSGNQLVISAGSSGQLYTQIRQGAPFDVFLSADTDKPQQLQRAIARGDRQSLRLCDRHAGAMESAGGPGRR